MTREILKADTVSCNTAIGAVLPSLLPISAISTRRGNGKRWIFLETTFLWSNMLNIRSFACTQNVSRVFTMKASGYLNLAKHLNEPMHFPQVDLSFSTLSTLNWILDMCLPKRFRSKANKATYMFTFRRSAHIIPALNLRIYFCICKWEFYQLLLHTSHLQVTASTQKRFNTVFFLVNDLVKKLWSSSHLVACLHYKSTFWK